MKSTILSILLALAVAFGAYSQKGPVKHAYPDVLETRVDSFAVKSSSIGWGDPVYLSIGRRDTVSIGTDGFKGARLFVMTPEDTVAFSYTNTPYRQWHYVTLQSPRGSTTVILRFNEYVAEFTDTYMMQHTGKVQVEVPEVYELANIIWALSPGGRQAGNLYRHSGYYRSAEKHFKPYLDHPVFKSLSLQREEALYRYLSFRENSLGYAFEGDKLVHGGTYFHVFGDRKVFGGLFAALLPQVEDFARVSGFREFYRKHQPTYRKLIRREQQLLSVQDMWAWLEANFPGRFQTYKIVFSPLIGSTHSTQQFWFTGNNRLDWFKEAVMFVSGPQPIDDRKELSENQKKGVMHGIVFTEIDHNYVNPESARYRDVIDSVFSQRQWWTGKGGDTDHYETPVSLFNEYMTHALFSLYVRDRFDDATAGYLIQDRERLMVEKRQYTRFREFNQALMALYAQRKAGDTVKDLYPAILAWARKQMK